MPPTATETNREPGNSGETNLTDQSSSAFSGGDHFENLPDEGETTEHPEPESREAVSEEETASAAEEGDGSASEDAQVADDGEGQLETGDDWLPTEQAKQFPLETLVEFATKRGYDLTQQEIASKPGIQKMLRDKLNTDIEIARLRREAEPAAEEETNPFEETEDAATEAQPTTTAQPGDVRTQHYAHVDQVVSTIPKDTLSQWGREVLSAWGVNTDIPKLQEKLSRQDLSADERAETTAVLQMAQQAEKIATVQARGVVDLVLSLLPQIMPDVNEQLYPGTRDNWERQQEVRAARTAWDEVSSATDRASGKALYPDLPKWGTKELLDLVVKTEQAMGLPANGLGNMRFTDAKGKVLDKYQTAKQIYHMVVQVHRGQKPVAPNPKVIQQAHETGRRKEQEARQRRAQGRAMGAGTSSRAFESQDTGDPMRNTLREAIMEDEADQSPFSHSKWKDRESA